MNISDTSVTQEADVEKGGLSRDWWAGNLDELDEKHPSIRLLIKDDKATRQQQRDGGSGIRRITPAQMLVVINFILQLLSAVIGLLNSNPRPLYSLMLLSLSFASIVLWIIELVHRGKRETVAWKWRGKLIPLLYCSSTNKSFFRGSDIVGLPSALLTFIITAVNFHLLVRDANTQIQITLWPIVAASFLLCSKFWADRTNEGEPNRTQLHSIVIYKTRSQYQKSSPIQGCKNQWRSQITVERLFAIVNFILEILSAVLDQLSSEPKPRYALILMLLSFCSSILCIFELWSKGKMERVTWSRKWISGKVLWIYPNKPFFSLWDKVGLISATVQLILTTVDYALVVQHIGRVPICVIPIVFALVLSFPKIYDSPKKTDGEGNVDEEDEVAHNNQRQTVSEVMFPKTESEEEKSTLIRNQSQRVNEEEFPKAEGNIAQFDKSNHPNLRHRGRKESVPKEIEEPSWVNAAMDDLKVVKKSLNELNEGACRLMNRNETVLVLKKYSARENITKTTAVMGGEEFDKVRKDFKQVNWVEKAFDEIQNKIELQEKTFFKIKGENDNMLEVELNKLKRRARKEESNRSSLEEQYSLGEPKKKTNWVAPAKCLDEIKKVGECLAEVKTKVVAFNVKIASIKKELHEVLSQAKNPTESLIQVQPQFAYNRLQALREISHAHIRSGCIRTPPNLFPPPLYLQ